MFYPQEYFLNSGVVSLLVEYGFTRIGSGWSSEFRDYQLPCSSVQHVRRRVDIAGLVGYFSIADVKSTKKCNNVKP